MYLMPWISISLISIIQLRKTNLCFLHICTGRLHQFCGFHAKYQSVSKRSQFGSRVKCIDRKSQFGTWAQCCWMYYLYMKVHEAVQKLPSFSLQPFMARQHSFSYQQSPNEPAQQSSRT